MTKQAPSSSSDTNTWPYHIFLSFRGEDTRYGFANNLHQQFVRKGIRTFIDHEKLQVGEEISPALAKAIEGSRIAIIMVSENYACSTFCLEELVEILECIKGKGRLVWPIFYKVDPCKVRHQIKSYKEAFDKHEKRFGNNNCKIEKWKEALYKVANLKGEHFNGNEYEFGFIRRIVQQVSRIINRKLLYISANHLVGLESRVQKVISLVCGEYDEVKCMVGICGIGGMGKSTIARVVCNLIADQFEGLCLLADVRENSIGNRGLVQLQRTLLFEILEDEDIHFTNVHTGSGIIKDRLQQKKVLLVLDDIDKLKQLQTLAGGLDWFGPGSRIIITTRDKHLLHVHGVERIYEVEELNDAEAYELFSWNAFKMNKVDSCHMNISMHAVRYCKGLPLALYIIGCNLFHKEIKECESALDAYERTPNKEIQEILKVSYDGLEENEKIIFLDIACFFKGYKLRDVKDILLYGRGSNPEYAISVLVEKSLINIGPVLRIVSMHDLIKDMGREIVRQESNSNSGEQSRLWHHEDFLDVLQENKGTGKIEIIMLNLLNEEEVEWDGVAFKHMRNLRVLIIKNVHFSEAPKYLPNSLRILDWTGYPSSSLPQDFYPGKLVMLNLPNCLLSVHKQLQKFKMLTHMDLSYNRFLRQVPDISGVPNLWTLNLKGCINLIEVHDSIGHHDRIRELFVNECSKLRIFPHSMKSKYLSRLDLSGCLTLPSFPKIGANELEITVLDTVGHSSFFGPHDINRELYVKECSKRRIFRHTMKSKYLSRLVLSGCLTLPSSPKIAAYDLDILVLDTLGHSSLLFEKQQDWKCHQISCGLSMFSKLGRLIFGSDEGSLKVSNLLVWYCHRIDEVLTKYFSWFPTLEVLILHGSKLTEEFLFTRLPWFPNLTELDLTDNDFVILPECINECCFLWTLILDRCYQLREIRGIPSSIKYLSGIDCTSLTSQSLSLLSSEKLHEGGGTSFILPGSSIPKWFDQYCRASSISFWFRKKFPLVALGLVFSYGWLFPFDEFIIEVHVNGHEIESLSLDYSVDIFVEGVLLFDLHDILQSLWSDDEAKKEWIKDGWNHVELKDESCEHVRRVECMGVYVYKQNTEDIRFTNPYNPVIGYKRKRSVDPREQVNM